MCIKVSHKLFKKVMADGDKKFAKTHKTFGNMNVRKDVQYIQDDDMYHRVDFLYPMEKVNGVTLFMIHGGGYLYGEKEASYIYASYFVDKGFNVVLMNYRLASYKENIALKEQVQDIFACLKFVRENRIYYKIDTERMAVMGDSAGGHLALLVNIIYHDKEAQEYYGIDELPDIPIRCYTLNSPMYDYETLIMWSKKLLSKKGMKTIFSLNYLDPTYQKMNSPRYYLSKGIEHKPMFASTSLHDYYRLQSVLLNKDAQKYGYNLEFLDEQSADKKIGHVYNHFVFDNEGKVCNEKMIEFILKYCVLKSQS